MTRVTEDDLEWLVGYCDGDSAKAARIVREIRAELLALRKVADAAKELFQSTCVRCNPGFCEVNRAVRDALREAGL